MQFIAQISLLLMCSLTGWLVLGIWQLPAWFGLYYLCLAFEKFMVIKLPDEVSGKRFAVVMLVLLINASIFNIMPVFLWFQDAGDILKFGTLAIVTGSTLNSFLTRARFPSILACYLLPNASVFLVISFGVYMQDGFTGEFFATLVVALAIATYFTIGLLEAHARELRAAQTLRQLQDSRQMEMVGRLTGGVSHDFNNLLSVISGSLQLLRDTKDEGERRDLINEAMDAAAHGSELTRQMLAFGQRAPLVPDTLEPAGILDPLTGLLQRLLPANIALNVNVQGGTDRVLVDANMIRSALINLAMNAKSAMPAGGDLTIHVRNSSKSAKTGPVGRFVEFAVSDTGEGIAEQDVEHVFEPFFTTRETGQGSGLGLAMVKGFVEQSDGHMDLVSKLGEGSTVSLFLPAVDAGYAVRPDTLRSKRQRSDTVRILVVDDNKQLLDLLALKLRRDGFEVTPCLSGDEAAEVVNAGPEPDLLLSDIVMPGDIQGPDLAKLARKRFPDMPVVLMSGYTEHADDTIGGLRDRDRFVEKPLDLAGLSDLIADLLDMQEDPARQQHL